MAEINFNNLYNQLKPMEKRYYDQQFSKNYVPGQENIMLSSQPAYEQMKAAYEAQQQVPETGIFDSIFGSASAAEMPQIPNLTYRNITPTFNLGTGITNTKAALPFKISVSEILNKYNVPNSQSKDLVNQLIAENQMKVNTADTAPFFFPPENTIPLQSTAPLQNLGIDTSYGVANEPDEEQVEYLTEQEPSGITKLFEFLQQFSPLRGLAALSDKLKQSSMYRPSTTGVFGYTPAQLNQMNALGGFYSAPERERRRRANRISNMLNRAAERKNYSEKNLSNLMNQFGMGDVDTGRMIDSIRESSNMGYGRGDVGQAATPGRDYSSSPGAMAGDMEYGEE